MANIYIETQWFYGGTLSNVVRKELFFFETNNTIPVNSTKSKYFIFCLLSLFLGFYNM